MKKILLSLVLLLALLVALCAPQAQAADDAVIAVTQTNASALATNYTTSLDFGVANPPAVWRAVYLRAEIPALTNNLVAATNMLFVLQDSSDNSTFTDTSPAIELRVAGVASTGSTAKSVKMPIPPAVQRYIRVKQIAGAYAPGTTISTNKYWLVVP